MFEVASANKISLESLDFPIQLSLKQKPSKNLILLKEYILVKNQKSKSTKILGVKKSTCTL